MRILTTAVALFFASTSVFGSDTAECISLETAKIIGKTKMVEEFGKVEEGANWQNELVNKLQISGSKDYFYSFKPNGSCVIELNLSCLGEYSFLYSCQD